MTNSSLFPVPFQAPKKGRRTRYVRIKEVARQLMTDYGISKRDLEENDGQFLKLQALIVRQALVTFESGGILP